MAARQRLGLGVGQIGLLAVRLVARGDDEGCEPACTRQASSRLYVPRILVSKVATGQRARADMVCAARWKTTSTSYSMMRAPGERNPPSSRGLA